MVTYREHIARTVAAIDAVVGPRGQWPGLVVLENARDKSTRDLSPPLSALGALALRGVPGADPVVARTAMHMELTVLPGGVWRYYAHLPWDTDDTAMCALALGRDHRVVSETMQSLAEQQRPDGLFPTWMEPGWEPAVDAVANAHIAAVLGPGPVTEPVVQWLNQVVANGTEGENCCFYPDPLDLHVAISRAVAAGVEGLRPALCIAGERAHERTAQRMTAYRCAQAIVTARAAGIPGAALQATGQALAASQGQDGFWPPEVLYRVGSTQFGGNALYTSHAVSSALCAKALSLVEDE